MKSDSELKVDKIAEECTTRIDAPAEEHGSIQSPVKLFFEILYLIIMAVPLIIRSIVKNLLAQPKSVKDKVVLVTGSGRGLGRGIAEKFIQLGSYVACVDIDENLNQETAKRINDEYPDRAKAYTCNVANMADVKKLEEAVKKDFGRVDILVNNAGIIACSSFTSQDEDFIDKIVGVNLTSHFYMIRRFLPDMIKRNEGHIVAISSISGFSSFSECSLYISTKSGVISLMNCLYDELKQNPKNAIKTSTVCPWFINTSAYYTNQWNLRYPVMSIEEAVDATVDGIRRDRKVFTIPSFFYYAIQFLPLLPNSGNNWIKKIFYVDLTIPSKKIQQNTPVFKLMSESNGTLKKTVLPD